MKNRTLKSVTIISSLIVILFVLGALLYSNKSIIKQVNYYANSIKGIAQYVDELDEENTSASFVLQDLDNKSIELIDGNKYKITTTNENVTLSIYNSKTNDEIELNEDTFELPSDGIIVKVDGISKGNTYDIKIEPKEANKGYKQIYKEVTIEINYENILYAYVKEIKDQDGNNIELEENDRIVFLYTDSEDKIRLRSNEDIEIEYTYSLTELSEEELNSAAFIEYDKNNYLEVSTNGYLYARSRYKTSGYSRVSMLHISNIDKLEPTITNIEITENSSHFSADVTYHLDDQNATNEYGKSGVQKYIFSKFMEVPEDEEWTQAGEGDYTTTVEDNGTYYIHVIDNAGNTKTQEVEVTEITFYQPGMYLLVLSSSRDDLIGKTYNTLQEMVDDFSEHNLTNNDTVLVQLEGDIKNQYVNIQNVNLTLDLNGYILESREEAPTFTVKSGATLKVVDNKYNVRDYINIGDPLYICTNQSESVNFDYTGEEQVYTIPSDGTYKFETWGASGAYRSEQQHGGTGGYSTGTMLLSQGDQLYINVGGQGTTIADDPNGAGGYNGGGSAGSSGGAGGGGGATHIATKSGLLSELENNKDSIIIVAGAGGGWANWSCSTAIGGNGGGFKGSPDNLGGTQTAGGPGGNQTGGSFGKGGLHSNLSHSSPGAGAGWYGGGTNSNICAGGGGSGYIGNEMLSNKSMYCNDCPESSEKSTKTISTNDVSDNPVSKYAKNGNGYAAITKVICTTEQGVIDYNLFKHGNHYGSISNIYYDTIVIEENGTFQMGEDNSPDIAHIEYPDHQSPYISGKNKAIINNGTFNFYDGIVYGSVALDGEINDTPPLYDPSVIVVDDQNDHKMSLEKVSNVEALIGKTRYSLLEDAIFAANYKKGTPDDKIQIQLMSDISKGFSLDISDQKNIQLDLAGHSLTTNAQQPVIHNYGKLEVIDSVGEGIIVNHNDNTILNDVNGELTITSGAINNDVNNYSTIFNRNGGKLTINGGNITKTNKGSTIFNNGGELEINGGTYTGYTTGAINERSIIYNKDLSSEEAMDTSDIIPLREFERAPNYSYGMVYDLDSNTLIPSTNDRNRRFGSYKLIDLTNYTPDEIFEVEISANVNVRENIDYVYAHLSNSVTAYSYSYESYRIMLSTGSAGQVTSKSKIQGGKKYYLYLEYQHASTAQEEPEGGNVVEFTNVKINKMHLYKGKVTVNDGEFNAAKTCVADVSYNDLTTLNGGTYNCELNTYLENSNMTINGGSFKKSVQNNNRRTYYINGGDINKLLNENGYIVMSGGKVNEFSNNYNGQYRYDGRINDAIITGGEIYGSLNNVGDLSINNAYISGYINLSSPVDVLINNTTFEKTIEGSSATFKALNITSEQGDITINNSNFIINSSTIKNTSTVGLYYNIYKEKNTNLYINNTTITNTGNDVYTGNRNNNNKDYQYALYNNGDGTITIDNTTINVTNNNPDHLYGYGIRNTGKGNVYIGSKDDNYIRDKNKINATYMSIYNPQSKIHFYDGIITSYNQSLIGNIYEIEQNYYINRFKDSNNIDTIELSLTGPSNVLNETNGVTYNSLGEAISAAGSVATLKFLNDSNYETINYSNEIKETQSITIDLNGKKVSLGGGLINNGSLRIVNNRDNEATVNTQTIINNNEMNIESGTWYINTSDFSGIQNNGVLTLSNTSIISSHLWRYEYLIENNNYLSINDGTLISPGDYYKVGMVKNNLNGKLYLNGGKIESLIYPTSGYSFTIDGRIIYNDGGYVEINGGTIDTASSYSSSYGRTRAIYNTTIPPEYVVSSGTINVNNGSIRFSASSKGYIPIDLSDYSGEALVSIKYYLDTNCKENSPYKMWITDSTTGPANNSTENLINSVWEYTIGNTVDVSLEAGKKYYLHVYGGSSSYLYINDIIIKQNDNSNTIFNRGLIRFNSIIYNDKGSSESMYSINSDIDIKDGEYKSGTQSTSGSLIQAQYGSYVSVTGGLIQNKSTGLDIGNFSSGSINNLSIVNSKTGININRSYVNINNLDVNNANISGSQGINCGDRSVMELNNSTINVNSTSSGSLYGISYNGSSTSKIINTNINVNSTYNYTSNDYKSYGIYATGGTTNVEINNTNITSASTKNPSYGYYTVGSNVSNLKITNNDGDNDGYVSKTTPRIEGNTYGIYKSAGTFEFYDGIIVGNTPIYGAVSSRPENYELVHTTYEEKDSVILDKVDIVQNLSTLSKYSSIQEAFDECSSDEVCDLLLLYDVTLLNDQHVDNDKTIILDLNTKTISSSEDSGFINNGEFHIKNGTVQVLSIQNQDSVFENYGKLSIEQDTNINQNTFINSRLITNKESGFVQINGGTITALSQPSGSNRFSINGRVIYNEGGYVEINDGTIDTNSFTDTSDARVGTMRAIVNNTITPEIVKYSSTFEKEYGQIRIGSSAKGYIPIDLTEYEGEVSLDIEYYLTSNSSENKPYKLWLTEDTSSPNYNSDENLLFSERLYTVYDKKTYSINGGKQYYLHINGGSESYLYITNITISNNESSKSLFNRGKIVINGGTIYDKGNCDTIIMDNADIEINGGLFDNTSSRTGTYVYARYGSSITTTGGTAKNKQLVYNMSYYTRGQINNTEFINNKHAIDAYRSRIDANNINIEATDIYETIGVYLSDTSELNMIGGRINIVNNQSSGSVYGIYSYYTPKIYLKNSDINVSYPYKNTSYNAYGIYVTSGSPTIKINNSTIKASSTYTNSYGVYAPNKNSQFIEINNEDGDDSVSSNMPLIQGDTYGIYNNSGTLNYYDGIIKGNTPLYSGVSNRPTNYDLLYGNDGTLNTVILSNHEIAKNSDTNITYSTIQSAIDDCGNDIICNLELLNDTALPSQVTISDSQTIYLDLKGKTIRVSNNSTPNNIINNGTLHLKNGTIEVYSIQNGSPVIDNYNKLYLDDDMILDQKTSTKSMLIVTRYTGKTYINSGEINATSTLGKETGVDGRIIYNEGGYVEINGGTINTDSTSSNNNLRAIYNTNHYPEITNLNNNTIEIYDHSLRIYANAEGYIPIDLSDYEGEVTINMTYYNGYNLNKPFKFYLSTLEEIPTNDSELLFSINSSVTKETISATAMGGQKYNFLFSGGNQGYLRIYEIEITQNDKRSYAFQKGNITINGGTINDIGSLETIQCYDGEVTMNGGTIINNNRISGTAIDLNRNSYFTMNDGVINNKSTAVVLRDYSHFAMNGGTILINGELYGTNCIVSHNGYIDINDGEISVIDTKTSTSYDVSVIYLNGTSYLNIYGGNIALSRQAANTTNLASTIYQAANSNMSINIGMNDGMVHRDTPHISSTHVAIHKRYNNCTLNYYDGKITSSKTHIVGEVNDIPENYKIVSSGNDYYLDISTAQQNSFEYNGMYFENTHTPLELIKNTDNKIGTIILHNDATIESQIVIPEGVDLTLLLEGHELDTSDDIDVSIINNGTLKIIDGSLEEIDSDTESLLINRYGVAIQNNGTLILGQNNNPNSESPIIQGTTSAVTGNNPQILSGKLVSDSNGLLGAIKDTLMNVFNTIYDILFQPSFSYKSNDYQVNKLDDDTVLSSEPTFRSVQPLTDWTNSNIQVGMTSHNVGVLSLVTDRDPNERKEVSYTVEVYKDDKIDEFHTYTKTDSVQYFDDEIIDVDLDWFIGVENKFDDYILTKMTINDEETKDIPEKVDSKTVFKLYYKEVTKENKEEVKGEEIVLNNPKTGKFKFNPVYIIAVIGLLLISLKLLVSNGVIKKF